MRVSASTSYFSTCPNHIMKPFENCDDLKEHKIVLIHACQVESHTTNESAIKNLNPTVFHGAYTLLKILYIT